MAFASFAKEKTTNGETDLSAALMLAVMKINLWFSRKSYSGSCRFLSVGGVAAVIAATFFVFPGFILAADTNAPDAKVSAPTMVTNAPVVTDSTNAVQTADAKTAAKPAKKEAVKERKPLSGAELYAVNCNRCHPERDPSEFTSAQWETMMIYMRVRANLPASHARAITEYLKDQAGQ